MTFLQFFKMLNDTLPFNTFKRICVKKSFAICMYERSAFENGLNNSADFFFVVVIVRSRLYKIIVINKLTENPETRVGFCMKISIKRQAYMISVICQYLNCVIRVGYLLYQKIFFITSLCLWSVFWNPQKICAFAQKCWTCLLLLKKCLTFNVVFNKFSENFFCFCK